MEPSAPMGGVDVSAQPRERQAIEIVTESGLPNARVFVKVSPAFTRKSNFDATFSADAAGKRESSTRPKYTVSLSG